jgi:hypothetical protein
MEDPLSLIDSIIHSWDKDKWTKLDQHYEVMQLYKRFQHQGTYKDELLKEPEDKGAKEDKDDEISPGCFILDIVISHLEPTKV